MAASSVISGLAPRHRAPRIDQFATFQDCLALDWNNGQTVSNASSGAFDATHDVVVAITVGGNSGTTGAWIAVGTAPVAAAAGNGSMWIGANQKPVYIYVPAGQVINNVLVGAGGAAGVSMIPALTASNA